MKIAPILEQYFIAMKIAIYLLIRQHNPKLLLLK